MGNMSRQLVLHKGRVVLVSALLRSGSQKDLEGQISGRKENPVVQAVSGSCAGVSVRVI